MEVGVDNNNTVVMEIPVVEGSELSSPPSIPPWLRRRLTGTKSSLSTVEEIQAKLRDAEIRRQKFYEHLSSKARPKPRSPPQSAYEEDLGQRLQAKLLAAEQKRSSILAKAQLRLAKLDQLRQAARTGVIVRVKKECAELGTKVELRVRQAETNRMRILKAYRQRRATLRERTSQSLIRRIARESKYKERVCAAISQKRAAAEKKRLGLLKADMEKAHARLLQVRKVAKSVSQKREIERRRLRESLEEKLQRAKRQRADYLMQRAKLHTSVGFYWTKKMQNQADHLSRKLARCWRKFLKKRTTFDLAKSYSALNINEDQVKSMPFDQFAHLIGTPTTLQTTKALFDRLEIRYKAMIDTASSVNSHGQNDVEHLLKRVASPSRRTTPRSGSRTRHAKKPSPARVAPKTPVKLSRYPVRIVLCAYMILGHPDAVFSGQGERENSLAESAMKFVQEFELLISIILNGHSADSNRRCTFRSQVAAFDSAWCAYLNSFVVWKVKDAESLEEDLVRAACRMEISMMQKCKMTHEGDDTDMTHDMKAIQIQVTEDQKLLREKVMHLSGDAGIERMRNALSDTRTNYYQAVENGSPIGSPVAHIPPSPSSLTTLYAADSEKRNRSEEPSRVVRALFKDNDSKPTEKDVGFSAAGSKSPESQLNNSGEMLSMENELIVNEFVHGQYASANSLNATDEDQTLVKVRETMEKAFWDGVTASIQQDNYDRVVELMKEVRDELCEMAPQSWRRDIMEAIDVVILSQLLNSGSLDMEYLGKIMEFALVSLQKLSAPANENNLKDAHQKVLRELADICRTDNSNHSHAIALVKGLRFVLKQIQVLKQEISSARIKIMEPLLKGPAGLEYLGKAFSKRFGLPSDASSRLPLTLRWLSSLRSTYDQDWSDHKQILSGLQDASTSEKHILPSTALRTGGSFSSGPQTSSPVPVADAADNQYPECKGEKADLLVRLGLLKLVNDVYGVTQEELPETLKLNFLRLRVVQSQLQKIIVTATSILVLRQTLVMEQMISSPEDMETTIQKCSTELLHTLDTVESAGLEEIVDILNQTAEGFDKTNDQTKTESRRLVMARMLRKSVQAEDSIFIKVSRAVYLATRGVVLSGSGTRGRQLAEMALRQVGAAVLIDRVVEAGKVLGVMASVSDSVHGPWYKQLVENM
uniref:T-complex protein 11 n=1 Tax=Tanacetum cinerariifolium TaxID=118510 RepID=A0A699HBZ0_TANCI|nr:T-complex protein 11 [Tanacetum cinerariifolium]